MKTRLISRISKIAVLLAFATLFGSSLNAAVILTTSTAAPGSANINQNLSLNTGSDLSGTIQERYVSGADIRSVAQVFTWNSSQALDKVGVRVSLAQDNSSATGWDTQWNFTGTQSFTMYVQQLNVNNTVASTLATETFNLTPSLVNPGEYIVVDFVSNISMINGTKYAITLTPQQITTQRIFFDNYTSSDVYAGGWSQQFAANTAPTIYTSGGNDLTFYTVAVPEPSTVALATASGLFCLVLRRRRGMWSVVKG